MKTIYDYYKLIKHFKMAEKFIQDVDLIEDAIKANSGQYSYDVINHIISTYRHDINYIGKLTTGVMIVQETEIDNRTDSSMVDELYYLRNCVVVIGVVACGIEDSFLSVLKKIEE